MIYPQDCLLKDMPFKSRLNVQAETVHCFFPHLSVVIALIQRQILFSVYSSMIL